MIELHPAGIADVHELITTQVRAFDDDNKNKPAGCSLEGPPGYDSPDWNVHWIKNTFYYKILFRGTLVGGLILFAIGKKHMEIGRIWVDPVHQNQGIGHCAMSRMFALHPNVLKWTLGTPLWAFRNQHLYEKLGFVKIRETEVDPHLGWSGIEYELTREQINQIDE